MAEFADGRALLWALRERLDEWIDEARTNAYREYFEGPDAAVSEAELRILDRVDSELSRDTGTGIWGADEYGIVETGLFEEESAPHVVCTYHPMLPEYDVGDVAVDDETHDRLDDALWNYAERVAELVQRDLEGFVRSSEVETWQE